MRALLIVAALSIVPSVGHAGPCERIGADREALAWEIYRDNAGRLLTTGAHQDRFPTWAEQAFDAADTFCAEAEKQRRACDEPGYLDPYGRCPEEADKPPAGKRAPGEEAK